jgi:hypothetical protein
MHDNILHDKHNNLLDNDITSMVTHKKGRQSVTILATIEVGRIFSLWLVRAAEESAVCEA